MNLILFTPEETARPLPRSDRRAEHILKVLRRQPGDIFDAGVVNGPHGKATLARIDRDSLHLSFAWAEESPPRPTPLVLVVGLPRPQTARDILRDATTLGATVLWFVATERSEPSYARSKLWADGEWRQHVIAGAEQAFSTLVPEVKSGDTLEAALAALPPGATGIALDNYEAATRLADIAPAPGVPVVLALGPERGWSPRDRDQLRSQGFQFAHLGRRVLRTETAVVAAFAIARTKLGLD